MSDRMTRDDDNDIITAASSPHDIVQCHYNLSQYLRPDLTSRPMPSLRQIECAGHLPVLSGRRTEPGAQTAVS